MDIESSETLQSSFKRISHGLNAHRVGNVTEARQVYLGVLSGNPTHSTALHLLGMLEFQCGNHAQALELLYRSIQSDSGGAIVFANLAGVLTSLNLLDDAKKAARRALHIRPDLPEAHNNLGVIFERLGHNAEASECFRKAAALAPSASGPRVNLGNALRSIGRVGEALDVHQAAIQMNPMSAEGWAALALTAMECGDIGRAISCQRRAVELRPNHPASHSNLIHMMQYDAHFTPEMIFRETKAWASVHGSFLVPLRTLHSAGRSGDRPLVVGYVSSDFREHPTSRLMLPILNYHDRERVISICYSDVDRPDETTHRMQKIADRWRDLRGKSVAEVAALIREDHVDVLVDLAGHTGSRILNVFAYRAAPVQFTYFGYPASTGMSAIDYRITDELSDPPGDSDRVHTETLVRLPRSSWSYIPPPDTGTVSESPCSRNGFITFGCLNRPAKVSPDVARLWRKILEAVPDSKFILHGPSDIRPRAIDEGFAGLEGRIEVLPRMNLQEYFFCYRQVDIALDTFPYNGGMTTCDALWSGVPVVALAGQGSALSRMGVGLLDAIGHRELITPSHDAYAKCAIELARSPDRLRRYREELRNALLDSPLVDHVGLTRCLESAYWKAWLRWRSRCESAG